MFHFFMQLLAMIKIINTKIQIIIVKFKIVNSA